MDTITIFDKNTGKGVEIDYIGGRIIFDQIYSEDL